MGRTAHIPLCVFPCPQDDAAGPSVVLGVPDARPDVPTFRVPATRPLWSPSNARVACRQEEQGSVGARGTEAQDSSKCRCGTRGLKLSRRRLQPHGALKCLGMRLRWDELCVRVHSDSGLV